jgi:hypothetical protein
LLVFLYSNVVDIRYDVESVNIEFPALFKKMNAVYPRVLDKTWEVYTKRDFEMGLNEVGWKLGILCLNNAYLVYLNPKLEGKRYLIQRALDEYRKIVDPAPRVGKRIAFGEENLNADIDAANGLLLVKNSPSRLSSEPEAQLNSFDDNVATCLMSLFE